MVFSLVKKFLVYRTVMYNLFAISQTRFQEPQELQPWLTSKLFSIYYIFLRKAITKIKQKTNKILKLL